MAKVKGFGGASLTQPWEVVKEFDFTSHIGTKSFTEGETYAWEGVDWTCRNLEYYGTSVQLINGTGLKIKVDGADTDAYSNWYYRWMNTPLLSASVADIVSDYDAADTICIQVLLTSSFGGSFSPGDGQYGGSFLVMTDGGYGPDPATSPTPPEDTTGNWCAIGMYNNGDSDHTVIYLRTGDYEVAPAGPLYVQDTAEARLPTFYEMVVLPACTFIGSGATTGSAAADITEFPDPLSTTEFRASAHRQSKYSYLIENMPGGDPPPARSSDSTSDAAPSYDLRPTNLKVCLCTRVYYHENGPTMNTVTTFTKMRILRRPRYDL